MPVAPPPPPVPSPEDEHAAEIIRLVAESESLHTQYHARIVQVAGHVAALRAAGWTWRQIDKETGVAPSTALGWVKAFAGGDDRTGYVPVGRAVPEPES